MADEKNELMVAPRAEVTAGSEVAGLIPRTIEEAYRLASAIAKSGLAPSSMNSPEKCLVAIMAGAEVGLAPYQAVQSFAVIGSRPVLWGDALLAVVLSKGFKVREWATDRGTDEEIAYCQVTRPDTGEIVERSFSVTDAKKAKLWNKRGKEGQDTPWITYPSRMLQMRARAFALRDNAADVLKGFAMREELQDVEVVEEVPRSSLRERLEANKEPREGFNVENPETPEELIAEIEPIGGERPLAESVLDAVDISDPDVVPPASEPTTETAAGSPPTGDDTSARVSAYVDALDAATSVNGLIRLRDRAADLLATLAEADPDRAEAADAVFNRRHEELSSGKLL